jgi:hypothetical protein
MKTGSSNISRNLEDTFSIPLLGFDALLKRCGFKDCVLFKIHNPHYIMNDDLFASGVCFNLFSEYGIGKKLEPLIKELFTKQKINPRKNKNNVYFQEIVNLANDIKNILVKENSKIENEWSYNYAIKSLMKIDQISSDRFERLLPLFIDFNREDDFNQKECNCGFCNEFRKFTYVKDRHVDRIIIDTVLSI